MRVGRSFLAVVALSCGGVVVPHTAAADEWNKQTVLTFIDRARRGVQGPGIAGRREADRTRAAGGRRG